MSNNQIDFSINIDTQATNNNLNKANENLQKVAKSTENAKKELDKLKNTSNTTSNIFKQATASITKFAGGFLAVNTAIKGFRLAINQATTHSEKFRDSLDKIKTTGVEAIAPTFEKIGDALSVVVNKVGEWLEEQNRLNGTIAITNQKQIEAIKNAGEVAEKNAENELKNLEELGAEADEINNRRLAGLKNIQNVTEKNYTDAIALQQKYSDDIQKSLELMKELKKQKDEYWTSTDIAGGAGFENPYEEQLKKAMDSHERLVQGSMELRDKILPDIKQRYKENNEEIAKASKTTKQTKKEEMDALASILARTKQINTENLFAIGTINKQDLTDKEKSKAITEENNQKYRQQLSVINSLNNVFKSSASIKDSTLQKIADELEVDKDLLKTEEGRLEVYNEILKKIKEITDENKKAKITWQQWANEGIQAFSQLNNLGQGIASLTLKLIDTSIYDKAIADAQAKITAFNEWKAEQEEAEVEKGDAEYEAYLEKLDKEYEIAKKVGDKMTMLAIENKKKELAKEQEKLEKEKEITAQEKALEKELAIAEYNKSYAEWQNECAIAEQNKQMNLAQAFIQPLQAAANAALGIAQSFAQFGLPGVALGTAASIGVIASAVSSASAYKSSAQQLDSVKNSPPTPPAFQFGTQGYQLEHGQSAIVGETGAEVIRNMAGKLVVESNAQAKAMGRFNDSGMFIENVIFNVNSIVDKSTIYKAMNEYKERDSFRYTR